MTTMGNKPPKGFKNGGPARPPEGWCDPLKAVGLCGKHPKMFEQREMLPDGKGWSSWHCTLCDELAAQTAAVVEECAKAAEDSDTLGIKDETWCKGYKEGSSDAAYRIRALRPAAAPEERT